MHISIVCVCVCAVCCRPTLEAAKCFSLRSGHFWSYTHKNGIENKKRKCAYTAHSPVSASFSTAWPILPREERDESSIFTCIGHADFAGIQCLYQTHGKRSSDNRTASSLFPPCIIFFDGDTVDSIWNRLEEEEL